MEELSLLNMRLEVISPFIWTPPPPPPYRCVELKFIFGSFFIRDDSDWKRGRSSVLLRTDTAKGNVSRNL